jgi:hypothetical protein
MRRHVRHTCCHIQAFGKLRQLRQRQQQQHAITALFNWALASKQYRRQLLLRVMSAWRGEAAAARQQLLEVRAAADGRLLWRMLHAWRQHMEEQVGCCLAGLLVAALLFLHNILCNILPQPRA